MRFKRYPRHAFTDTPRKRAALRRKQQRERDALPLFAAQIAEEQPSEDQEMRARAKASEDHETQDRSARARAWRKARCQIDALPADERRAVRRAWDCAPYPGDPSRLAGLLANIRSGTHDLTALPYPLARTDGAGIRLHDIFDRNGLPFGMSLKTARKIATVPDQHALIQRRAAYHALQDAANARPRSPTAMPDRVLASALFRRLGEMEDLS